jgi:putative endonuclease
MATVYILYSQKIDTYYVGSCSDLELRLEEHRNGKKDHAFTKRSDDWFIHFSICDLEYELARKIEEHIKKMKSRKYIENLILYPEISQKLIEKYSTGSSR